VLKYDSCEAAALGLIAHDVAPARTTDTARRAWA
jgi:hypothetical protein